MKTSFEVKRALAPLGANDISSNFGAKIWPVFFLFCVGSMFRVYNFWAPGLWIDEYGTWWVVTGTSWTEVAQRAIKIQGQSPFYYLIVKLFTDLAGYSAFVLRLPSILFGIATLALVYPLALSLFDNHRVAILSLGIFATSEQLIWYSQNARPYSLALFLSLLSFWFLLSLLRDEKITYRLGYGLTATLLVYAHFLYGFALIIQVIYLLFELGWRRLANKKWLITFALIGLLLLPLTGQLVDLFGRRQHLNWIPAMPWFHPIVAGINFALGSFHPVTIVATVLAVVAIGFDWKKLGQRKVMALLKLPVMWSALPFVSFIIFAKLFGIVLFDTRYLLFGYPAVYFLMAWFMSNLKRNHFRQWIPPLVFLITTLARTSLPALINGDMFSYWTKWEWADAASVIANSYQAGDIIVLRTGLIEANQAVVENDNQNLTSYVNWALLANLIPPRDYKILMLPFVLNETTRTYFASADKTISSHRRVWLVGEGEVITMVRDKLILDSQYRLVYQPIRGRVQLFLLEKEAAPSRSRRLSP